MNKSLSAFTIFLGSFLIFGVQPMVGRTLLPVFGGTAAVWVVCLCAFQTFLLGGYLVADRLGRRLTRSPRAINVYLLLLVVCACWMFLVAMRRNELLANLGAGAMPAMQVVWAVLLLVGVPYMLLSANSSLVQALSGGDYRLYAVSNLGSLIGLVAYPFLFEPYVSLTAQWGGFGLGILVYASLLFSLGKRCVGPCDCEAPVVAETEQGCAKGESMVLAFLLPALSCFLLDALTTHVTLDVMPMPLIWTASLGIFLASYIVGFSGFAAHVVRPLGVGSLVGFLLLCYLNEKTIREVSLPAMLGAYGGFLFLACSFLHSWLYTTKPRASRLTRYYLFQSMGGAIGGITASLVFPSVAKTIVEYPVALFLVPVAVAVSAAMTVSCGSAKKRLLRMLIPLAAIAAGACLYLTGAGKETRPVVYRGRGFFGTIEVLEAKAKTNKGSGVIHEFVHGTTVHGIQALLPGLERMPTTYYTTDASGYAIVAHPKYRSGEPMRVNVTGLGVGVLFSYARKGDYYRAYEISEDALAVATNTNLFTFVSGSPAMNDIVLGDARKGLEAELAAGVEPYDVIVVDAFTGDNLPYHLSTREAFDLYFKLLKSDGILCVNISNWHLALEPFMKAVGTAYGVPLLGLETRDDYANLAFGAKIALFCRAPEKLANPPFSERCRMIDFANVNEMQSLPTDEKGSFVSLIRW